MNTCHTAEYFTAKSEIESLSAAIAEKRKEIETYQRKISETTAAINEINELLAREELLMGATSRLNKPTLTVEQFMAQKKQAAKLESELPELTEALGFLKKSIDALDRSLSMTSSALRSKVELVAKDLIDDSAEKLIDAAGELFKDLAMAVIVNQGKMQGRTLDVKQLYKQQTSIAICEHIFQRVFGYDMPDLHDANKHLVEKIESAA